VLTRALAECISFRPSLVLLIVSNELPKPRRITVAAEEQELSGEQRELVAISASIGAGCHPCVSHHLKAGMKAGLSAERMLACVVNAELAAAESAERLSEHARVQLGSEVEEPKTAAALDKALASLGGALGSNDLANVEHQLLVCQHRGMSPSQLREAIELGRAVQENATRMHFRAALDLLERAEAPGHQTEDATSEEKPASDETSAGAPDFVSMMARLLALMDSCDSAVLKEKMAECFSLFEPSCCKSHEAPVGEEQPDATLTSESSSACDCTTVSSNCSTRGKDDRQ
jgi:AhpD family alkylhydroperoxidase